MKDYILYIGGFRLPDKNAAAQRVYSNGKVLYELGYDIVFIDLNTDKLVRYKKRTYNDFYFYSEFDSGAICSKIKFLYSLESFKKALNDFGKPKMVICYNYPSIAFYRIIKYCKLQNIKIIADCTEWYESKSLFKKIDTEFRMRFLNKQVNGIICISSYLKDFYKNKHSILVPPLIDMDDDIWSNSLCNSQSSICKLIYIGNPGKNKDKLNFILKALKNLEKYQFTIIGLDKNEYLRYYPKDKNLVDDMKDNVMFLGRHNHKDSLEYLKKSNYQIFIRENRLVNNAGFPTKFVESTGCNIPVITTNTSDIKKYIVNGKNGFIVDIDNLENELKVILSKDYIGKNEVESMKIQFDWKSYIKDFRSFLKEVLDDDII